MIVFTGWRGRVRGLTGLTPLLGKAPDGSRLIWNCSRIPGDVYYAKQIAISRLIAATIELATILFVCFA